MRLRDGVDINGLIDRVNDLIAEGNEIPSFYDPRDAHMARDEYFTWAEEVVETLRHSFVDRSPIDRFRSPPFWRIVESSASSFIIPETTETQVAELTQIVDRLRSYGTLRKRHGHITVPDTNALLHYNRLDRVDWTQVVKDHPVRLIVPLLVLDELDNKKYLGSEKIIKRARSALKPMEELRPQLEATGVARLEAFDVTVEYLIDEPGHQRIANPDEEIVDRAYFLKQVTDQPVTIVTADYGMRARAVARGLRVVDMPSKYARDGRQPPDADGVDTASAASTPYSE